MFIVLILKTKKQNTAYLPVATTSLTSPDEIDIFSIMKLYFLLEEKKMQQKNKNSKNVQPSSSQLAIVSCFRERESKSQENNTSEML